MVKRYLTTTLPYVNSKPHLGFALELVQADVLARLFKEQGYKIFLNTGTDEHGLKLYRQAIAAQLTPQAYVDQASLPFKQLLGILGVIPEANFVRTTDSHHQLAAQEFWRRCAKAGDIYKKVYRVKYCIGCELEKTESELTDGKCPLHPNQELELIEEENYFFRFSKYAPALLKLYADQPALVIPSSRLNEVKAFVDRGLEDFSISRLKSKLPWGVPVPDDPNQVMYVWFDALTNYLSALGWPEDELKFEQFWQAGEPRQLAGKDNLRQQAAMWQAMLMSAGLPPTHQIYIHGFLLSGGQKMSKSLGNVIDPVGLVTDYGSDALRYYLLRHVHPFEDSDVTLAKFTEAYNANLANGLGNLVSRILKMAETNKVPIDKSLVGVGNLQKQIEALLGDFEFKAAMNVIWHQIGVLDQIIQEEQPFKLIKSDRGAGENSIKKLLAGLWEIAAALKIFLPQTATTIQGLITKNQAPEKPLFMRKD